MQRIMSVLMAFVGIGAWISYMVTRDTMFLPTLAFAIAFAILAALWNISDILRGQE